MKIKLFFMAAFFAGGFWWASAASAANVTIAAPVGGESWAVGTTQQIMWDNSQTQTSSGTTATVQIALSPAAQCNSYSATTTCPSAGPYVISPNAPNTGAYSWDIPTSLPSAYQGPAVITLALSDNSASGTSSVFTITAASQTGPTSTSTGTPPTITQLTPNSGTAGTSVTIVGSGFAPSGNTIQFGPGTYLGNISSDNGSSLQFTVPSQTQPCPPENSGACTLAPAIITPGVYDITVANNNGTSTPLQFSVMENTPAPEPTPTTTPPTAAPPPNPETPTSTPPVTVPPQNTLPYADGSLVMANNDPTVYLVSNGSFVPFTRAQIFLARGYQWSQVQAVPPDQITAQNISAVPVLAPDNSLIRSFSDQTVYVVNQGKKSPVTMDSISSLGLDLNNVIFISDAEMQNYPDAPSS